MCIASSDTRLRCLTRRLNDLWFLTIFTPSVYLYTSIITYIRQLWTILYTLPKGAWDSINIAFSHSLIPMFFILFSQHLLDSWHTGLMFGQCSIAYFFSLLCTRSVCRGSTLICMYFM